MAKINLLPWREERRTLAQQEFFIFAGMSLAAVGLIVGAIHLQMSAMIEHQETRNKFVKTEISFLDRKIAEIKELRKTKQSLIDRMNVIQNLQQSRPTIVHIFDELVRTVPDGVYLQSVSASDKKLEIKGEADSNARVSAYMRNLDKSEWLTTPQLSIIKVADKKVDRVSAFQLTVTGTTPDAAKKDGEVE